MALPLGVLASADNSIGVATVSNSGTARTDAVMPITIPFGSGLSAQVQSDFSRMRFFANGSLCQHWVGNVKTSNSAVVYVKVPNLTTGTNRIGMYPALTNTSSSSGLFKVFTDFPSAAIPSGWEVMSNGANRIGDVDLTEGQIASINNYTAAVGSLTLCRDGGGPVSILSTTSDVGVNVAIDTKALLVEDTFGVSGFGSIWELGLHGQPVKNDILIKNGLKYRWDARYTPVYMGLVVSYSRTSGSSGVATINLDQSQKRPHGRQIVVGDEFTWTVPDATWSSNTNNNVTYNVTNKELTNKIVTLTTSTPHGLLIDDPATVTGVDVLVNVTYRVRTVPSSTTFTYSVNTTSSIASTASSGGTVSLGGVLKVKTVTYNGNTVTITYDNPGQAAVSLTNYTNAYPTRYFLNVWKKNHQGYLDGPYGGTYTANGLTTNNGGWNNFDADIYLDGNGSQELSLANGSPVMRGASSPEVWSLRYANNTYKAYVNNVSTERTYVVGTTTKYVTSASLDANIAFINTSGPHGLKVGQTVTVSGVGAPFDGTWTVFTTPGGLQFTFQRTNANIVAINTPNPAATSVTYTDTVRGLDGKALIASHIGAAVLNWVAVYDVYNNVSDPVYTAGV
jgi:hypothetical protein